MSAPVTPAQVRAAAARNRQIGGKVAKQVMKLVLDQPEKWMNENEMRKLHWSKRSYLAGYWRQLAKVKASNEWKRKPPLERVHVVVTFFWPDARRRDPNNWSLTSKALVDGITDAGLVVDDDSKHVIGPDHRAGRGPRRIEIEVYELPAL